MLAFRSFARSMPRALTRVSRPVAPRAANVWPSRYQPSFRAFSQSIWKREPAGEFDQELSAKLAKEHQLELENESNEDLKASINDYINNSPFKIEDKAGNHTVTLTRQFGNENIKIEFSVADIDPMEDEFDPLEQDNAFEDEGLAADTTSGGKRTINQSGAKGGPVDVVPEDSIAPSDREEDLDDTAFGSQYPLHLDITITKPGQGATSIQAQAQNGTIDVAQLSYYPKAELVEPKTPEDIITAEAVYKGPSFTTLDSDLQTMVLQYLEERGINAELAEFLPEYVDYKEQREYVRLLDNLKKFIDA